MDKQQLSKECCEEQKELSGKEETKTSEELNGLVDPNLLDPSHQVIHPRILSQSGLEEVVPLDQTSRIHSLLLSYSENLTTCRLFRDVEMNPWNLEWALEKLSLPLRPVLQI